jgi:hypothetical protein
MAIALPAGNLRIRCERNATQDAAVVSQRGTSWITSSLQPGNKARYLFHFTIEGLHGLCKTSDENFDDSLEQLLERNEGEQQRNDWQQGDRNQLNHGGPRNRHDAHAAYDFEAVAEIGQ